MLKVNKALKSLALASVFALTAASLSALPASAAAPEMAMVSAVGPETSFNTLNDYSGETDYDFNDDGDTSDVDEIDYNLSHPFALKVYVESLTTGDPYLELTSTEGQKFAVTRAVSLTGSPANIGTAVSAAQSDLTDTTAADGDSPDLAVANADGITNVELLNETGWQVVVLQALNTDGETPDTVEVSARLFVDRNEDLEYSTSTPADYPGPTVAIKFLAAEDITSFASDFVDLGYGDNTVTASITTSPALNLHQIESYDAGTLEGDVVSRTFDATGDDVADLSFIINDDDEAVLNDANVNDDWAPGETAVYNVIVAASYRLTATMYFYEANNKNSTTRSRSITAPDAHDLTLEVTSAGNVNEDAGDYDVRSGVKSLTVEGTVVDIDDEPVSGSKVTISLQSADMDSRSTISAGGKTYTVNRSTSAIEVEVTTNADGEYSLAVTTSTADAGDSFAVAAEVDVVAGGDGTESTTVAWEDTAVAEYYQSPNSIVGVTETGSVSLEYWVFDQFGKPVSTSGDEALKVYIDDDGTAETAIARTATVSNGIAKFNFANAEDKGTNYTINAYLYVDGGDRIDDAFDFDSGNFDDFTGNEDGGSEIDVYVWEAASASVDLDSDGEYTGGRVGYGDFLSGLNIPTGSITAADVTGSGTGLTISGQVEDVDGNIQPGAPVTLAGTGYQFIDSGVVYAKDSITVYADSNGEFSVVVHSHKVVEEAKIAVSAGTGKADALVTFDLLADLAPVLSDADVTWTVSGPSYSQSGRTSLLTATLADKWGNGIPDMSVDVELDGIGLLNGTDSIARDTNASGQVKAYVSVVPGDSGSTEVTFTLTEDSDPYFDISNAVTAKTLASDDIAKATNWGVTYANASAKGKVRVDFGYAKGKRVKIFVDGVRKFNVLKKSDKPVLKKFSAAPGSHRVVVKVDGVTVTSRTVTVK